MLSRNLLLAVAAFAGTALTQSGPSPLKFEVATIKPSAPGGRGGGIRPLPGGERYQATNMNVKGIMTVAWRIKADQITGGPAWLDSDRFDMNAKAEKPSTVDELHEMLKNLLTEQFKLRLHTETKEMPVYALTVDKGGPKMTPHEAQSAGDPWIDVAGDSQPGEFLKTKWHATFSPMNYFAFRLSQIMDRPVIDQTGLKGGFDFDLAFTRDLPPGIRDGAMLNGVTIDTSGPTIFDAVQKQLGLKLERQKGPVEILAIDGAEKPAGN